MDQTAVRGIMDKIKIEEQISDMQQMWLQNHRNELRQKVSKCLEFNIFR